MDDLDKLISMVDTSMTPKDIDKSELMVNINRFLHDVLVQKHKDARKHDIKVTSSRLNMACPFCGDSTRDHAKKRGNIYLSSLWYKCYNAPCVSMPLVGVISKFGGESYFTIDQLSYLSNFTTIDFDGKGGIMSGVGNKTYGISEYTELEKYGISRDELMEKMGMIEVFHSDACMEYVKMRCLDNPIYGSYNHLGYDPYDKALVIFNLTSDRNKVVGVQKRFMAAKKGGFRFMSYTYEQLLEKYWGVDVNRIKEDIRIKMSKITLLYNFLVTRFDMPVLILESGIDSNHIHNSVGLLSASTNINLKANGFYMYDNSMIDKTGNEVSTNRIENGYNVFMWRKFVKDYPIFKYCKDLNDIFKAKGNVTIDMDVLKPYFSNDIINILDV